MGELVFVCEANGTLKAGDDAKNSVIIKLEDLEEWKEKLAFDHYRILSEYKEIMA